MIVIKYQQTLCRFVISNILEFHVCKRWVIDSSPEWHLQHFLDSICLMIKLWSFFWHWVVVFVGARWITSHANEPILLSLWSFEMISHIKFIIFPETYFTWYESCGIPDPISVVRDWQSPSSFPWFESQRLIALHLSDCSVSIRFLFPFSTQLCIPWIYVKHCRWSNELMKWRHKDVVMLCRCFSLVRISTNVVTILEF